MVRIILKDIKSMLGRPLVFILLFIGLAVGSFAVVVYYVSSSTQLKVHQSVYGVDTVVEAPAFVGTSDEIQALIALADSGELPEISYLSAVSFENEEYDIVGIYWDEQELEASYEGRFIDASMMGQAKAVAPRDIFDDRDAQVGDTMRILGRPFEIVGLTHANGYAPDLYDVRRLRAGAEDLAGVELERPWQEELAARPERAVVIPLDTFAEIGLCANYYHITFAEPITAEQREEIENAVMDGAGLAECTDMTQFMQINEINHLSKALVYFAAIAAGIINIVSLFAFFLKENRKQYITYKLLGATGGRIAAIVIAELALYTLIAFAVGCAGAVPFIEYSGFVGVHVPYGIWDFAAVYLALLAVELLICLGQIRRISVRSVVRLRGESGGAGAAAARRKEKNGRRVGCTKFLRMLSFRYSRSGIIRTVSIVFLSLTTAFSLAYAMTYVFEAGRYERYAAKAFPNDIYEFMYQFDFTEEAWEDLSAADADAVSPMELPQYRQLEEKISMLSGVAEYGRLAGTSTLRRDGVFYSAVHVNAGFAKAAPIPLKKGSWEALAQYDPADESAAIPVVIPPYLEKEFPLGEQFALEYRFVTGEIKQYDENGEYYGGQLVTDDHMRQFVVAGVMADDALVLTHYINHATLWPEISHCLFPLYDDTTADEAMPTPMYMPDVLRGGRLEADNQHTPKFYLFPQAGSAPPVEEWNSLLAKYGEWESFGEMISVYTENFHTAGGNQYFMHAAVASALLILGVGGYSIMLFAANRRMYGIYYVCGMPWSKAAGLTVAGNALDMLLPAAVGAVAGVYVSQGIRVFDETIVVLSVLTGAGAVLALYALTSAIIALSMRKARPKRLMAADGR